MKKIVLRSSQCIVGNETKIYKEKNWEDIFFHFLSMLPSRDYAKKSVNEVKKP